MTARTDVSVDRGWLVLYQDMGVDACDVLRRAQLPDDLFLRENAKLSVAEYFRLWNASDEVVGDPALPIRLAEAITAEAFNPMVFAALCSPDLTVAMQRIAAYKRLVVPMTVTVEECSDGLVVSKRWDDEGERTVPASLAATDLVMLTQIARMGLRERIVPLSVTSHLPMEPRQAFRAYFGVAPIRGAARSVTFRAEDARKPFLTASPAVWQTFEPELQRRLTTLDAVAPLSERVRSVLLESLPSGEASMEVTARRLGLSSRTLQRRLKQDGASFKEIVRSTREQLACHYLANTLLGYAEISFLVGFEEPSSFFRAFREWTGATPESMRLSARN
jgi:AraC-like DNA-binding protein